MSYKNKMVFQVIPVAFCILLTVTHAVFGSELVAEPTEHKVFKVPEPRYRLPTTFLPFHYDLKLLTVLETLQNETQLTQWTAPGSVTILGTCVHATTNITLHSQGLQINETSVKISNLVTDEAINIVGHEYDTEKTFYIIMLEQPIQAGSQYSISIEFVAPVSTDLLEGLYRSHYDDPITGETKYLAATQFQAFAARRAFPCFDEPALKATFTTTLGRRANYTSLCNTPLVSSTPIPELNGWFWDEYNITVPMPTYLVAIIISDYDFSEASPDLYNKPVRTYGPKHLIEKGYGTEASIIAAKTLYFYEQFFDVEYAMHKMDSIGIIDFAAGAMENWGLNIYGERYLLYSAADQNNERDRRGVALTLNHELAHQWSGNLVTCDWWTMAWLNEGFATYLSYHGMEFTNPEYEVKKAFQYDCTHRAMQNDVLDDSHPTVLPDKGNPWETMSYNANLVYSKGAALLRMMEGFLTLETLQKGLQTYFKQYTFQATNQDQLFAILTAQAQVDGRLPQGVTIKEIMDTWTLQKGYPLINVGHNGNTVTISQKEYKPDNQTRTYFVPVAISTQSSPNIDNTLPQYWLYQEPNGLNINFNSTDWIAVNSGGTGYYRVEYDAILAIRLETQLISNHQLISLGTRTQLIDDHFQLAYDRGFGIQSALIFTKYLADEKESSVWNPFFYHMKKARTLIFKGDSTFKVTFKSYIRPKVSGALNALIDSGADLTLGAANLFYVQLLEWNCDDKDDVYCSKLALDYYEQWKAQPQSNPIPPLIRTSIDCLAVSVDETNANFQFALERFANATSEADRIQILIALGCKSDKETASFLLGSLVGSTEQIPKELAQKALDGLAYNSYHYDEVLRFLDERFDDIVAYIGSARIVANAITIISSTSSSQEHFDMISGIISKHESKWTEGDLEVLNRASATFSSNVDWMLKFGNPMGSWMSNNLS